MDKQLWELVFAMKSGQGMQCVTSLQPEELDSQVEAAADGILRLTTVHAQHKDWPIAFRIKMSDVSGWYMRPHETYLAARGKLSIS